MSEDLSFLGNGEKLLNYLKDLSTSIAEEEASGNQERLKLLDYCGADVLNYSKLSDPAIRLEYSYTKEELGSTGRLEISIFSKGSIQITTYWNNGEIRRDGIGDGGKPLYKRLLRLMLMEASR